MDSLGLLADGRDGLWPLEVAYTKLLLCCDIAARLICTYRTASNSSIIIIVRERRLRLFPLAIDTNTAPPVQTPASDHERGWQPSDVLIQLANKLPMLPSRPSPSFLPCWQHITHHPSPITSHLPRTLCPMSMVRFTRL